MLDEKMMEVFKTGFTAGYSAGVKDEKASAAGSWYLKCFNLRYVIAKFKLYRTNNP